MKSQAADPKLLLEKQVSLSLDSNIFWRKHCRLKNDKPII